MQLLDLYQKHPYEPLVPQRINTDQMVYKFNSPQHFLSYVQELHAIGSPSHQESSRLLDNFTVGFTLSKSLGHAYEVIRETKFDPTKTDSIQTAISLLKVGTFFSDEGHELEIPEFLAGGDKVWLKQKSNRKRTRLIEETLLIDTVYNSGRDAETARQIGMEILTSIYRRRVIPRKMVLVFGNEAIRSRNNNGHLCSVDVSFSDLNGIAKMLHPSAFRRVYFRLIETYPDLAMGYGRPVKGATTKGYISIDTIYNNWQDKKYFEGEIDKFLGVKS